VLGAYLFTGRHRGHGQFAGAQGRRGAPRDPHQGAELLYLPPYSPDLNPIELLFAKLKALLRKAAERSITALWDPIGELRNQFSAHECRHYLAHVGYV
jgi:transposase